MAEISEQKRKEIEREAQEILRKFSSALEKVKIVEKRKEEKGLRGFREEGDGAKRDEEFRKRMFENASEKDENFIITEKKEW